MSEYEKHTQQVEGDKEQGEYTPSVATDFLRETIKQKPVNKKKLLRRTVTTIVMAVVFGIVACLTFLVLQPVINSWLNPEPTPELIVFPEEQEEVAMEEFYLDDHQMLEEAIEESHEKDRLGGAEKVQDMLSTMELDSSDYEAMYTSLKELARETERSVVTVTGVTEDVDWFQNIYQNEKENSGVIIAQNGMAYFIAVVDAGFATAEMVLVTFYDGTSAHATYVGTDKTTGLSVVSVPYTEIDSATKEGIKIASLGSSKGSSLRGTPVIAIGSPAGVAGSVSYGVITSTGGRLDLADSEYKLITTDIYGSTTASGIIVGLNGYVLGVIENKYNEEKTANLVSAYGISELKKMLEKLSNGEVRAYLGVHGADIPSWVQKEMEVPNGAYVTGLEMNSPAMSGGIQKGDIIVSVNGTEIAKYHDLVTILHEASPEALLRMKIYRQTAEGYAEIALEIMLDEMMS